MKRLAALLAAVLFVFSTAPGSATTPTTGEITCGPQQVGVLHFKFFGKGEVEAKITNTDKWYWGPPNYHQRVDQPGTPRMLYYFWEVISHGSVAYDYINVTCKNV